MSDAVIALLVCPHDPSNPETAFDWFPSEDEAGVRPFLSTTKKTTAPKGIQVLNLAAGYPAALARIESLAAMIGANEEAMASTSDSYALFSLWQLIVTYSEITQVALVRCEMAADLGELSQAFGSLDAPFHSLVHAPGIILFDRGQTGADLALLLAIDAALSGAIYSHNWSTLPTLLEESQQAARSLVVEGMDAAAASVNTCACLDEQSAEVS